MSNSTSQVWRQMSWKRRTSLLATTKPGFDTVRVFLLGISTKHDCKPITHNDIYMFDTKTSFNWFVIFGRELNNTLSLLLQQYYYCCGKRLILILLFAETISDQHKIVIKRNKIWENYISVHAFVYNVDALRLLIGASLPGPLLGVAPTVMVTQWPLK